MAVDYRLVRPLGFVFSAIILITLIMTCYIFADSIYIFRFCWGYYVYIFGGSEHFYLKIIEKGEKNERLILLLIFYFVLFCVSSSLVVVIILFLIPAIFYFALAIRYFTKWNVKPSATAGAGVGKIKSKGGDKNLKRLGECSWKNIIFPLEQNKLLIIL